EQDQNHATHREDRSTTQRHKGTETRCVLPGLLYLDIEREAAVLITDAADSNAWSSLILEFHHLALRGCSVRRKRDEQISSHALLDRDPRTRILLISSQHRIYRKL